MTHQPPLPEAATSPYPLHPEPIPEERKLAAAEEAQQEDEAGVSPKAIGVGAAIGLAAAAAAVTGVVYARRRSATAAPRSKAAPRAKAAPRTKGDDKSKRGKPDRSRVAAGEQYEVQYFARKHGIKAAEARAILKEAGPNRDAANALAARRKKA